LTLHHLWAKVAQSAGKWGNVAGVVFQGASELTLDGKGRLTIPARHREVLDATCGGQLTLTKHPEGFLLLFPRPEWEQFREKLMALPMDAARWKRTFLGYAMDVEIDGSSRVPISPELRSAAGLTRDVTLLGMGHFFEIWDRVGHKEQDAKMAAEPVPASMKDFVI
jgi:MraZ protein